MHRNPAHGIRNHPAVYRITVIDQDGCMDTDRPRAAVELRASRTRARMTQEELAEASGVSVRTLRGLEGGRIRNPHRPTLLALAAGLGLDQRETSDLVDRWRQHRDVLDMSEFLDPRADVEAMIARFGEHKEVFYREVSLTSRTVIGPDRLLRYRETQLVKTALVDGIDSMMFIFGGDPMLDVEKVKVNALRGCELGELIPLPETNEVLFFLDLGRQLRVGETVTPAYSLDLSEAVLPQEELDRRGIEFEPSTGVTWTMRTPLGHFLSVVEFRDVEPPARLWQVAGKGLRSERAWVRDLGVDRFGTVHVTADNVPIGTHGIKWEWDHA